MLNNQRISDKSLKQRKGRNDEGARPYLRYHVIFPNSLCGIE